MLVDAPELVLAGVVEGDRLGVGAQIHVLKSEVAFFLVLAVDDLDDGCCQRAVYHAPNEEVDEDC